MKIVSNKNGWLFQGKETNLYIDPQENVKSTNSRQIIIYTDPNKKYQGNEDDKFIIDSEGRYEVGEFFIEGLYINNKKSTLSYYISYDNLRFLYVDSDFDPKGEDSQKNIGSIDALVVRPNADSKLDQITSLTGEYDPAKIIVLLDILDQANLEKVVKFFGMKTEDIEKNFNIKQRDIIKSEDGAEPILITKE